MIFRVAQPSAPLRPFIENFWYHEGIVCAYPMERLVPDGGIELIVDLTPTPKKIFDNTNRARATSVRRAWIAGQRSGHLIFESAQGSKMIGARFRPGGAWPFVGMPVAELNEAVVEMDVVWGAAAMASLRDRLLESATVDGRFAVLEQALLARARGQLQQDPGVAAAVRSIVRRPGTLAIGRLAAHLGYTQKRLVDRFTTCVGLRPKAFARVVRFQHVLHRAAREPQRSWTDLAHDAGYYDQAHFVHDFQALSGLTPTRYAAERASEINFLPVWE
jgi:AraC-like DNA-binding protein